MARVQTSHSRTAAMAVLATTAPRALRAGSALRSTRGSPVSRGATVVPRAKKSAIKVVTPAEPEPEAPTPLTDEQLNSLPPEMLERDIWDAEGFDKLGENVKNWGLFFVVFMAAGAGVVAANTYNDGAVGVDFQAYESPDAAVVAAMAAKQGVVAAEAVLDAPETQ